MLYTSCLGVQDSRTALSNGCCVRDICLTAQWVWFCKTCSALRREPPAPPHESAVPSDPVSSAPDHAAAARSLPHHQQPSADSPGMVLPNGLGLQIQHSSAERVRLRGKAWRHAHLQSIGESWDDDRPMRSYSDDRMGSEVGSAGPGEHVEPAAAAASATASAAAGSKQTSDVYSTSLQDGADEVQTIVPPPPPPLVGSFISHARLTARVCNTLIASQWNPFGFFWSGSLHAFNTVKHTICCFVPGLIVCL